MTGLGATALSPGLKALVGRLRPVVDATVATAPGPSFPSGHALGSTVAYGVLLLVFLPAIPQRRRRAAVVFVVGLVGVIGATRVALGVHFPSDVVGGWLLGLLWLAVATTAFLHWGAHPRHRHYRRGGLVAGRGPAFVPAPVHDDPLPKGWRSAAQLIVAGVLLGGGLAGVGVVLTEVAEPVRQLDIVVVRWFAVIRSERLTAVAVLAGHLGSTVGILLVQAFAVPVWLATTRRWRPPLFQLVAVVGETALFLAVANIVGRPRPAVEHVAAVLPPTSSFPSGHVAAAVATYGAIAMLARVWTRGWAPHVFVVWAVIAPLAVALSRLYRGVHYPSDVVASVVYALIWLAVCWRVVRPVPGSGAGRAPPDNRGAAASVRGGGHGRRPSARMDTS